MRAPVPQNWHFIWQDKATPPGLWSTDGINRRNAAEAVEYARGLAAAHHADVIVYLRTDYGEHLRWKVSKRGLALVYMASEFEWRRSGSMNPSKG